MNELSLKCENCGAILKYAPGTKALKCEYCGSEYEIASEPEKVEEAVKEIDYKSFIRNAVSAENLQEVITTKCNMCGAEVTLKPNLTSDVCPFCGTSVIVSKTQSKKMIKPKSLLPFEVTDKEAHNLFKDWIKSLWFAPNNLKAFARREEGIKGVYLPYWTYDANTVSRYTGQRGVDYYINETYTAMEDGRSVTKTRQVRKTRWYPASGTVRNTFDDVLVVASKSLPDKYVYELEPWDVKSLVPYKEEYLSGFRTESYQIDLENGFEVAKDIMGGIINETIRRDIGGDHQRINSVNTDYSNITFKHILLPIWLSSYRYREKIFRFMINARTGEVQGERPYSWIKITLAVITALVIFGLLYYFFGGDVS